uniref:Uncharacterized protein n=1 Tax=Oryza rufipogon TaxID=4529 RepID=A0A0E0P0A8_ORYRU
MRRRSEEDGGGADLEQRRRERTTAAGGFWSGAARASSCSCSWSSSLERSSERSWRAAAAAAHPRPALLTDGALLTACPNAKRRRHPRDLAARIWSVLAVLLNDGGGGGASSPALTGDGGADWSWSRSRRSGGSSCSGIKVGLLHGAPAKNAVSERIQRGTRATRSVKVGVPRFRAASAVRRRGVGCAVAWRRRASRSGRRELWHAGNNPISLVTWADW